MNRIALGLLMGAVLPAMANAMTYKEMFGADPDVDPKYQTILKALDFKQQKIVLPGAHASLTIGKDFYYLDAADTAKVLGDLWGNPPDESTGTLGMIFPATKPPEGRDSWGTIITYSDDGYISDEEAESTDFSAVLSDLQSQMKEGNPERVKAGYDPITLVGWASPPHYDKSTHVLHWARELVFGNDMSAPHTLNYQLRVLGREGVLQMNFVAGINQLQEIQTSVPSVSGLVQYDPEKKYEDHKDGDKVAAYGLAGLIAVGAGAKIAAKVGFLAVALLFLKKGAVVILIAAAAILRPITKFFKRNKGETPPDIS